MNGGAPVQQQANPGSTTPADNGSEGDKQLQI